MAEKYVDDKILHIKDDIEKIQRKPTMYISNLGEKGVLQLAKELVNNGVDECINPNSPANKIDIVIDENTDTIIVKDNGRGISEDKMIIACTELQSGSKFERDGVGTSAGEYGVGLTACNAMSEVFYITTIRYGKEFTVRFKNGKQDGKIEESKASSKHNGTIVAFKPSKYYLGEDAYINSSMILEWLSELKYLISDKITISLSIIKKNGALADYKFKNKNGIVDYLSDNYRDMDIPTVSFSNTTNVKEMYRGTEYDRFLSIDTAFSYNKESEFTVVSFCNAVRNIDNGSHADAVKNTLSKMLLKKTREAVGSKGKGKSLEIISQDVLSGMILVLYLKTDMTTHFSGQTKEKLNNPQFVKPISMLVEQAFDKFLMENPTMLKKLTDRVKLNARARIASLQTKNSVIKGETSNFDEHLMENFIPANNIGKHQYRELIIIEGKSAKGTARSGRYSLDTQAIYSLRGVPLNPIKSTLEEVLKNPEYKNLVTILGCNIGAKFNLNNLKYDKIIILTDSDADGYNIASSICAFFLFHMPEIVNAGKLYKAVAPLYKLKDSKNPFVLSKLKYVQLFEKIIKKSYDVRYAGAKESMPDKELEQLLFDNRLYDGMLSNSSDHTLIEPSLLEYIIRYRKDKNFDKILMKKYPSIEVKTNQYGRKYISGVYNMKHQFLLLDDIERPKFGPLVKAIDNQPERMDLEVKRLKEDEDYRKVSLGEFLSETSKYKPVILTRYKGVGELDANDLRKTTLDPNTRILIRLTVDDLKKAYDQFQILHGNAAAERKLMMEAFKITREELDN